MSYSRNNYTNFLLLRTSWWPLLVSLTSSPITFLAHGASSTQAHSNSRSLGDLFFLPGNLFFQFLRYFIIFLLTKMQDHWIYFFISINFNKAWYTMGTQQIFFEWKKMNILSSFCSTMNSFTKKTYIFLSYKIMSEKSSECESSSKLSLKGIVAFY